MSFDGKSYSWKDYIQMNLEAHTRKGQSIEKARFNVSCPVLLNAFWCGLEGS